jgi:predicted DNA-binding ribbon-helix-helix protein
MCRLFAHQPIENYQCETRSLRIGGHGTSIRLEALFWVVLEEISAGEGLSLGRFLTKLHDEVLDLHGKADNFASLLRCSCLIYLQTQSWVGPRAMHHAVAGPDARADVAA